MMKANPTCKDLLIKIGKLEKEITASKRVEEALKKSEEFSSRLLIHYLFISLLPDICILPQEK